jgi:predicted nucleotidyltransferase
MFSVDWQTIETVCESIINVQAAWVFGSAREGSIKPGSDLDIGVLFFTAPSLDERVMLREQLQKSLSFDDIDLVILNEASPITRFEAICGRQVFVRDRSRWAEFFSLTAREYEDEMAFLQKGMTIYRELQRQE